MSKDVGVELKHAALGGLQDWVGVQQVWAAINRVV